MENPEKNPFALPYYSGHALPPPLKGRDVRKTHTWS
jgi:hypothetical protein